jgi:hypothetical protein
MADTPEFIDSRKIFEGRVFDVTVDTVREHGQTYVRDVVHHPGERRHSAGLRRRHDRTGQAVSSSCGEVPCWNFRPAL